MKKELEAYYRQIRAEEKRALERRAETAYRLIPELGVIARRRAEYIREAASGKVTAEKAKENIASLQREEESLLTNAALPVDSLRLRYRCDHCKDTGIKEDGTFCECSLRYTLTSAKNVNATETFESFREDIYVDPEQRTMSKNAKAICEAYANALPKPEKPNLLIRGSYGLGKSFLANAVARRALERGVDAELVTAYTFAQEILSDIRNDTDHAVRYRTVPLFILDDLGCEPVIRNVSNEWLFAILNERMMHGLATIVVTNLDYESIGNRYGDRLLSRLVNRSVTRSLQLSGRDLRMCLC